MYKKGFINIGIAIAIGVISLLGGVWYFTNEPIGAPTGQSTRHILPFTDAIYDIGTSTARYRDFFTGDIFFYDEILPDGATCSNGQILKKTGANNWDCASDNAGAGGTGSNWDFDITYNETVLTASTTIPVWFKDTLYASSTSFFQGIINDGLDFNVDSATFFVDAVNNSVVIGGTNSSKTVNGVTKGSTLTTHITGGSQDYTWVSSVHSNTVGPVIAGARSRGSEASPTQVQDGDNILDLLALGYDGTDNDYLEFAAIHMDVDGTAGQNDAPGMIRFLTTPDGSVTLAERMRIDQAGNIGIGDTTPTYKLTVGGEGQFSSYVDASYFVATSSSATSTFPIVDIAYWVSSQGNLGLDLTDNGSDLTLHANVGGINSFFIDTDGTFFEIIGNPGAGNGYEMFAFEETQGADTAINFYEGGIGHNRIWNSGSMRIGGASGYLCTNLTDSVDCDTSATGADLVVEDDIWLGGQLLATSTIATSSIEMLEVTTLKVVTAIEIAGEYISNFTTYVRSLFSGGSHITISSGSIAVDDDFLLNDGDIGTGVFDFGGATSFEIVNGSNPTVDTTGEIALDTTSNQLLIADSGGTARVFAVADPSLFGFDLASTSPRLRSGGYIEIPKQIRWGRDITQFYCRVDGGTSVVVNVSDDGTNDTETITCDADGAIDTDIATNSTFSAGEFWRVEIGTITGAVDFLVFEVYGYITRE